jgi:phospholipid/cholesterol/gamma-HCH transport system substrate-binding protein
MRRALAAIVLAIAVIALIIVGTGSSGDDDGTYKVRALFDNASFLIQGQDVKVAGAKVGTVEDLDVQVTDEGPKAAIVLRIDKDGFKDFRSDAHCEIRLQSVIGEKLVECTPTQPRGPGEPEPPPLQEIPDGQPGAGQHLLPVSHTVTPVDADLINSIQRRPFRERFSIILNELGAGLASRATDLKELLKRANPGVREFDEFLNILANQNKMLGQLNKNADVVLGELAKRRKNVANFFVQSRVAAQATAERREAFEQNWRKFPAFLRELKPFMDRFAQLSRQMAPVVSDLRVAGPDVSRIMRALGPFSLATIPALKTLGNAADVGRPALVAAKPVAERLAEFTHDARRVVRNLRRLFTSLQQHKGLERFVDTLMNVTLSTNGFDEIGHYLRNNLIVTVCSGLAITPTVGCGANFRSASAASAANASASTASAASIARRLIALVAGPPKTQKKSAPTTTTQTAPAKAVEPAPATTGDTAPSPASDQNGRRAPSIQNQPERGDALLDYLLGGSQ